jgi:hypothetical protein
METHKIKASREEFAEVLFYWLSRQINREAITQAAKLFDLKDEEEKDACKTEELFGLNLTSKEDFNRLFEELFDVNMWLVVRACERVIEDLDKRNECLDILHRLVYERLVKGPRENLRQWTLSLTSKYIDYNKAAEIEQPLGPAWEPSKVINKNLHGKVLPDAFLQFQIGAYITESLKALEGAIKKYDIE